MTETLPATDTTGWALGPPPRDYVLGHVRAVLPDTVLDDARVVVRDGRITAVEEHRPASGCDVDGRGLLCMPGLIDVHSDALEKERAPRPSAVLPWDFALVSLEGKLRAAGITTVFHGAGFQHKTSRGTQRSPQAAKEVCDTVRARTGAPVEHRLLYRLDIRSEDGATQLREQLAGDFGTPLVSHEDHTPGQGQYVDRSYMERYLMGTEGMSADEAERHVDELIAERTEYGEVMERNLAWLGDLARAGRIRLAGHDPDSAEAVGALCARGGAVAEFPTTVAAAEAAREHGLPIVMGAPNVLRGTSHSGNVSARDLVRMGLVTALASDYLPSGLLAAAFRLVEDRLATLPAALALVTAGPAEVTGLTDRGALRPGLRADLALVEPAQHGPVVWAALRAADGDEENGSPR
jgi:alpha-D-ribose 1-methylphosphonate 5-triphosphate diphosphatase